MSARVVLHLPDDHRARLEAGETGTLYARIRQAVATRGGTVVLRNRFPQIEPDGDLHIVDNARRPHPDTLISAQAYLDGCWHLDPEGVLADSSIAGRAFDPASVDPEAAAACLARLRHRYVAPRHSRYHQKRAREEIDPSGVVIFLQGPPPYVRGHAHLGREEMIRTVVAGAGGRPVYVKPHPLRKEEGVAIIRRLRAEGLPLNRTNANVHDLLSQAAVTVSANSAASFEGFLHGTPAILFARADFAAMAEVVTQAAAFPAALARALATPRDYAPFLSWYLSQCLWPGAPDFEARLFAIFGAAGFDADRLGLAAAG
ncbi:hypothetical protein [Celeribacter indicus]|uniref:Capsule polysaccharide biosynthesis protein n=1 Tax=Celeribacter indicus TaxID=1208324 RepID=A0A0B5DZ93_9RHOB|nr:hypothetical protein [Celeribacter indicus]AJE46046.1 hypothetical protein P73_1331 [Celeribacter indicus]SDX33618.1 hypothetical protein SAMN05443573_12248 [Celeribacter indicus]